MASPQLRLWSVRVPIRESAARIAGGIVLSAILLCVPRSAAARSITVAWDPNPEPNVAGYVVYVGTEPGVYTEQHDVGRDTWFVYSDAADDRRYYFSVSAYAEDLIPGPRSAEAASGVQGESVLSYRDAMRPPPASANPGMAATTQTCVDASPDDCFTIRTLLRTSRPISGIAATPDNRLFFIDNGQQILTIDDRGLSSTVALAVSDISYRLSGIVVSRDFAQTHVIYVGEIEVARDGTREMSIVRYREVQGVLGERAVVVPGLEIPVGTDGIFTIDSAGRIYVAIPADDNGGRSTRGAYSASILRFDADGGAARDNGNASPILARGVDRPSAFAWRTDTQLLITSTDPSSWLAGVDLAAPLSNWSRPAVPVTGMEGARTMMSAAGTPVSGAIRSMFVVDGATRLNRLSVTAQGTIVSEVVTLPDEQHAAAVTQGMTQRIFVVASPASAAGQSILELTPSPPGR